MTEPGIRIAGERVGIVVKFKVTGLCDLVLRSPLFLPFLLRTYRQRDPGIPWCRQTF